LGLVLMGFILKDAFSPAVVAQPQGGQKAGVKIEGGDKDEPKEFVGGPAVDLAPIDPTPRLVFAFHQREWGLTALRVRNQVGQEGRKQITYSPNGGTSSTVLRIDGIDHALGQRTGHQVHRDPAPDPFNGREGQYTCKNVWVHDNIQVTQALSI